MSACRSIGQPAMEWAAIKAPLATTCQPRPRLADNMAAGEGRSACNGMRTGGRCPPAVRGAVRGAGQFRRRASRPCPGAGHVRMPPGRTRRLAVLTFEPHPRELFRPEDPPFRLSLPSARADALGQLGRAARDRGRVRPGVQPVHRRAVHRGGAAGCLGAVHLACGPDFAFGHRRGGDVPMLSRRAEALGMGLSIVPPLADARGPISSTRIRRALQDGYPERATADLGRPWSGARHGCPWGCAGPHDRLSHRQHRPWAPAGAGARRLCRDAPWWTVWSCPASPISAAARRWRRAR